MRNRDSTRDEIQKNGRSRHVHSTNAAESNDEVPSCPDFYTTGDRLTFDFGFSHYLPASMPQFSYKARNVRGELVEGVLECADRTIAIHQIEQKRCIPIRIEAISARAETGEKKK